MTHPDRLGIRDVVIQSALCHPDWNVTMHCGYLDSEWWQTPDWRADVAVLVDGVTAEQAVSLWLAEFKRVKP
jgi:hypothetical protein